MDIPSFMIFTFINGICFTYTLINIKYQSYKVINSCFAQKYAFKRIKITLRQMTGYNSVEGNVIDEVIVI